MPASSRRAAALWLQRTAGAVALVCLSWAGYSTAQPFFYDRAHAAEFEQSPQVRSTKPPATSGPSAADFQPRKNDLVGKLEIPRLGFSQSVAEGDDDDTLKAAIGHLPDTPFAWQPGNSAYAGHRDALFRPLRDIRVGDRLTFTSRFGSFHYKVRQTFIVEPTDLWVLSPAPGRMLTLVTCYPFTYVGKAPQRFVVQADPE
jgi:sortase A